MITETSHRPWELPRRPWMLAMRWHDLLFMHWPMLHVALRALIPPELALDTFDGTAWIGVVPFRMNGVRPRGLPALPWLSVFPELNLRTYVTTGGKPGVWFFSLDAANPVVVRLARKLFYLPYYDAHMASKGSRQSRALYQRPHAPWSPTCSVSSAVSAERASVLCFAWDPGALADRAVLPLFGGSAGSRMAW
jgi:uncharacterized protein YqjF (DUF2071 family)